MLLFRLLIIILWLLVLYLGIGFLRHHKELRLARSAKLVLGIFYLLFLLGFSYVVLLVVLWSY